MIDQLMIVDDNEDDQMVYRRIIKRSGLVQNFHQFFLAEEALTFLRDPACPSIEAILLDINMPGMDGFQFLEAATKEFGDSFARVAVVMLTTSLLENDKQRASQYAIVKDYLNKPLAQEHLEKIDRMLRDG